MGQEDDLSMANEVFCELEKEMAILEPELAALVSECVS